jgi:hypothetical protein
MQASAAVFAFHSKNVGRSAAYTQSSVVRNEKVRNEHLCRHLRNRTLIFCARKQKTPTHELQQLEKRKQIQLCSGDFKKQGFLQAGMLCVGVGAGCGLCAVLNTVAEWPSKSIKGGATVMPIGIW